MIVEKNNFKYTFRLNFKKILYISFIHIFHRLMNGTEYDPGNKNITPTLCYWSRGKPDNALYEGYDEYCAFIPFTTT